MQNFEHPRIRILYSQKRYESPDLDMEYTDSIKMIKQMNLKKNFMRRM